MLQSYDFGQVDKLNFVQTILTIQKCHPYGHIHHIRYINLFSSPQVV